MNLDPIRPYLSLIKIIVAGILICGLFVAGCMHGEHNKQDEVDKVQTSLTAALDANRKWVTANEEANRQVEANKKAAAEQQKLAEIKAKELVEFRTKTDKKINKLSDQLEAAMEEPECVDLLKAKFCSAVPLPVQP